MLSWKGSQSQRLVPGHSKKVSAIRPQSLMATTPSSQEDMVGTLIQTIRQEIQKALPQTSQKSSKSRSSSSDGCFGCFRSPGPKRQSAIRNQNQKYTNSNKNTRYNNSQNKGYNSGHPQNNRYNRNCNTPNQQKGKNNTNQQTCRQFNRTNLQSRICQDCFNRGRMGHPSSECRAPQRNQKKGNKI